MHRLLNVTDLFLILTSPKCCRDQKKKKINCNKQSLRMFTVNNAGCHCMQHCSYQEGWYLKMSKYFPCNWGVLPLGWGFKTMSAHECALLQCQHNSTSDVEGLYRPYSKPGHAFTSYRSVAASEGSGVQTILFPGPFFSSINTHFHCAHLV